MPGLSNVRYLLGTIQAVRSTAYHRHLLTLLTSKRHLSFPSR